MPFGSIMAYGFTAAPVGFLYAGTEVPAPHLPVLSRHIYPVLTPELKFRCHVRSIDRFGAVLAEARFNRVETANQREQLAAQLGEPSNDSRGRHPFAVWHRRIPRDDRVGVDRAGNAGLSGGDHVIPNGEVPRHAHLTGEGHVVAEGRAAGDPD